MSMISEQIKVLRDIAQAYGHNGVGMILKRAADTIEELSAKLASANMERSTAYYNDGWIPCSERLPVEPIFNVDSYLVQQSDVITPYSAYWDGMCWSDSEGETLDKIIAWQPLPKRYQPKGE